MKKIILLLFINLSFAQINKNIEKTNISVEKNLLTAKLGLGTFDLADEFRIDNSITLNSEIGYSIGFKKSSFDNKVRSYLIPKISIEPRWYYNLNKRIENGKSIRNNAANFFGFNISYFPKDLFITNYYIFSNELYIAPSYGFKRNIGKSNFNYEFTVNAGLDHIFDKVEGFNRDKSKFLININFRFGYNFKTKK